MLQVLLLCPAVVSCYCVLLLCPAAFVFLSESLNLRTLTAPPTPPPPHTLVLGIAAQIGTASLSLSLRSMEGGGGSSRYSSSSVSRLAETGTDDVGAADTGAWGWGETSGLLSQIGLVGCRTRCSSHIG